ncbi:hypothetical protein Tco_1032537 [Tanacetum coccineum]|uniref:Uncharacterized protein n=1 Tax=Tanacetum coccineum TaxID=301880 RepID=A0ABQ5GCK3_9ASTR
MANLKYSDKHNMVAFLKEPIKVVGFTEFWQTATVRTLANGTQQLVASIDSKEYTITEASVRSKLQLADATGIHNLSDAEIYVGLATLGGYAGDFVPLLPAMLAGAAMDQGDRSAQPAENRHTHLFGDESEDTKQTLGNVVLKLVKKVKSLEIALKRKSKKGRHKKKMILEAKLEANTEVVKSLQRECISNDDFVKRSKPMTQAQQREVLKALCPGNEAELKDMIYSLGTRTSKKQKLDTEDALITKGKDEVVKEEEAEVPVKKTWKEYKVKDASSESDIGVDAIPTATKPPTIKYGANRPEEMYDRVLWGDLKTMFDLPLSDDAIWSLPLQ